MISLGFYERVTNSHVYFLKGPLSQWWPSEFMATSAISSVVAMADPDKIRKSYPEIFTYKNCEQYMMHNKAMIMGDFESHVKILAESNPKAVKELGRNIRNFNQQLWDKLKILVVAQGNYQKFLQNKELYSYLMSTSRRTLVEASPYDNIWGVGISQESDRILSEGNWTGKNLLGKCLMDVRDRYKSKEYMEEMLTCIKEAKIIYAESKS